MKLNLIKRRELQRPLAPSEMDSNFEMIENVINNNVGGGGKYEFTPYLIGPYILGPTPSWLRSETYVLDISKIKHPDLIYQINFFLVSFSGIVGASLLTNIRDAGTAPAIWITRGDLSTETINSLFSQLPVTNKVATINLDNNPGSATCDPTIATAKGYIVVT